MSAPRKVHYDNGGRARCGHGPQLNADENQVTCKMCLNLLDGTHGIGNYRTDVKPCGTPAAYQRHRRRQGVPVRCETCLAGERRRGTDYRRAA